MKNHQLNARIDEKAYTILTEMTRKLRTTKAHLTEKAIYLLQDHFNKLEHSVGPDKSADTFLSLLSQSTEQYDDLYRKLAK